MNGGLGPVNYGNIRPWLQTCFNSKSNEGPKKRKGTKVTTILTMERGKKCCGKASLMVLVIEFESYVPNLNEFDSNVICETVDYR